jgi:non-ribosomal peptide synthetase component F
MSIFVQDSGIYFDKVPIGRTIKDNYLLVVHWYADTQTLIILPDGEAGELLIIGEHVASGYYNNESTQSTSSISSSAFMSNPFYLLSTQDDSERRIKIMTKKTGDGCGIDCFNLFTLVFQS